jgi:hypothetical protein
MGMDIHMSIVRNGKYVYKDIFDGRDTRWFNSLQMLGCGDDEYQDLPAASGIPYFAPEEIVNDYNSTGSYFGFFYITVRDYVKWFRTYKPHLDAGWVTTYDKWKMDNKGYIPEDPIHYLDKETLEMYGNDLHFVSFEKKYDSSKWLYDYLMSDVEIENDDIIVYYFDN